MANEIAEDEEERTYILYTGNVCPLERKGKDWSSGLEKGAAGVTDSSHEVQFAEEEEEEGRLERRSERKRLLVQTTCQA